MFIMSKTTKIFLGLIAIFIFLYGVLFFVRIKTVKDTVLDLKDKITIIDKVTYDLPINPFSVNNIQITLKKDSVIKNLNFKIANVFLNPISKQLHINRLLIKKEKNNLLVEKILVNNHNNSYNVNGNNLLLKENLNDNQNKLLTVKSFTLNYTEDQSQHNGVFHFNTINLKDNKNYNADIKEYNFKYYIDSNDDSNNTFSSHLLGINLKTLSTLHENIFAKSKKSYSNITLQTNDKTKDGLNISFISSVTSDIGDLGYKAKFIIDPKIIRLIYEKTYNLSFDELYNKVIPIIYKFKFDNIRLNFKNKGIVDEYLKSNKITKEQSIKSLNYSLNNEIPKLINNKILKKSNSEYVKQVLLNVIKNQGDLYLIMYMEKPVLLIDMYKYLMSPNDMKLHLIIKDKPLPVNDENAKKVKISVDNNNNNN